MNKRKLFGTLIISCIALLIGAMSIMLLGPLLSILSATAAMVISALFIFAVRLFKSDDFNDSDRVKLLMKHFNLTDDDLRKLKSE